LISSSLGGFLGNAQEELSFARCRGAQCDTLLVFSNWTLSPSLITTAHPAIPSVGFSVMK
jgi:hypothetical protein